MKCMRALANLLRSRGTPCCVGDDGTTLWLLRGLMRVTSADGLLVVKHRWANEAVEMDWLEPLECTLHDLLWLSGYLVERVHP